MLRLISLSAILIIAGLFLFWGCSDKDNSTGSNGDPTGFQQIAVDTIGTSGGAITTDNFELTIPAGALTSNTPISVYQSADEEIFDSQDITPSYRIDGLPETMDSSLKIGLKYSGSLVEESFVVLGWKTYVPSTGDTAMGYRLLTAQDSSGWLTCNMPSNNLSSGAHKIAGTAFERFIKGTTKYRTIISENFYYVAPEFMWGIPVTDYLEEAHDTLTARGCNLTPGEIELYTKIDAVIEENMEPPECLGYARVQLFAGRYVSALDFNAYYMNPGTAPELPEYEPIAGRVLFDHIPYSYERPYDDPSEHWLHKAFGVWIEELFSSASAYIPSDFKGHEMAPFNGLEAGCGSTPAESRDHGFGMAAVIKYITDSWDDRDEADNLGLTYERMINGIDPTTALLLSMQYPADIWYREFLKDYIQSNIYDVPPDTFINHVKDIFWINDSTDTMATFTGKYPDLSAGLYAVNLGYDMSEHDSLVVEISSPELSTDDALLLAFHVDESQARYIRGGTSSITLYNLQGYREAGKQLLIAAVNCNDAEPYTDSSTITVTMQRCDEASELNDVTVTLGSIWVDLAFIPDTCSGYPGGSSNFWSFASIYGSTTNNTFTGTREYTSYGVDYHDEVTVTLNPEKTMASVEMLRVRNDSASHFVDTLWVSASDIPVTTPDYGFNLQFMREGTQVCGNMDMAYRRIDQDIACDYVFGDYSCDEYTRLIIYMR